MSSWVYVNQRCQLSKWGKPCKWLNWTILYLDRYWHSVSVSVYGEIPSVFEPIIRLNGPLKIAVFPLPRLFSRREKLHQINNTTISRLVIVSWTGSYRFQRLCLVTNGSKKTSRIDTPRSRPIGAPSGRFATNIEFAAHWCKIECQGHVTSERCCQIIFSLPGWESLKRGRSNPDPVT